MKSNHPRRKGHYSKVQLSGETPPPREGKVREALGMTLIPAAEVGRAAKSAGKVIATDIVKIAKAERSKARRAQHA